MNTLIQQISEVESAASAAMDDANMRKKAFAQEMAEKTAAFDRELDARVEQQLGELRSRMEARMEARLAGQQEEARAACRKMEQNYEDHHSEYVRTLFHCLIKE